MSGKRIRILPLEHRCGWSLVETCVVIGVAVILIALLLPVLNLFTERSRDAKCVANLRAMHTAIMLYANDNQGKIPVTRVWTYKEDGTPVGGANWRQLVKDYLFFPGDYDSCPAAEKPYKTTRTFNYGINPEVAANFLVAIQKPSACLLVADTPGTIRVTIPNPPATKGDIAWCHDGSTQGIFLDGHAGKLAPEQFPPFSQRTTSEYKAFWTGR